MLRVVLAEDNYLIREGTVALLSEVEDLEVVAAVSDLPSLLDAVAKLNPDVVITDIRMPPGQSKEGIEAAKQIRATHPNIGVLVLSQYDDDEYAQALLKDGAKGLGYLLKERVSNIEELAIALREVARGGTVLEPRVVEGLVQRKERTKRSPLARISERERDVLEQMAQGKTNAAIAKALFLSERAIEKHITALFQKLDLSEEPEVHRRVMAVLTFLRESSGFTAEFLEKLVEDD